MDEIIRAITADGFVKLSAITARAAVERARAIHGCAPTSAAALGRALCAASMLGELMKEEDASLTIRINGGGPIGSVVAVSDHLGNMRGYVTNPQTELPLRADGKLDVGGAVGRNGMFTVSRDIGLREPYIGSTELATGEIAEDLAGYLAESEQIPAACALGVLVDTDTSIRAAGGFIAQLMPGAPEELITRLEDNVFMMDQLTTILDEDGIDAVAAQVLRGMEYETVMRAGVEYRCLCSRERVLGALKSCGRAELEDMAAGGADIEVGCQFCDRVYNISPAEISSLIECEKE